MVLFLRQKCKVRTEKSGIHRTAFTYSKECERTFSGRYCDRNELICILYFRIPEPNGLRIIIPTSKLFVMLTRGFGQPIPFGFEPYKL